MAKHDSEKSVEAKIDGNWQSVDPIPPDSELFVNVAKSPKEVELRTAEGGTETAYMFDGLVIPPANGTRVFSSGRLSSEQLVRSLDTAQESADILQVLVAIARRVNQDGAFFGARAYELLNDKLKTFTAHGAPEVAAMAAHIGALSKRARSSGNN